MMSDATSNTGEGAQLPFDPDVVDDSALPQRFGRYELQGVLGDGGTARVFRAELLGPANFRKPVALKIVKASRIKMREGSRNQSLIFDEARIGGRLIHPNLVETYDVGEVHGRLFVAMQLIDGLTSRHLTRLAGPLPSRPLVELTRQIAEGLAHAHALKVNGQASNLVHRDLKPANVLVGRDGVARIADFGIARAFGLTDVAPKGAIWGTIGYMAPEQAFSRGATQASDIFSFGVMIAEFALGRRFAPVRELVPYVQALRDLPDKLQAISAALDDHSPGLGPIITRCLSSAPAQRFCDARPLVAALAELSLPAGSGLGVLVRQLLDAETPSPLTASTSTVPLPPIAETPPELSERPPLSTPLDDALDDGPRTNLGLSRDAFVGRQEQVNRLTRSLTQTSGLLTLVGPVGIGKSRLALHIGESLATHFEGGVWYVDLAQTHSADALLAAVAECLEVPTSAEVSSMALEERVGRAIDERGPILIILDGLDHFREQVMPTVVLWRRMATSARFLVTARERLDLPGDERVERVSPLETGEAVSLLTQRVRSLHPDFEPDAELRDSMGRLVVQLDTLPLAIELAAAQWVPDLTASGLLDWVKRLSTAEPRSRTAGSLRATLEDAWRRLTAWEQTALAQLTVFRGGFSIEAAAASLDLSANVGAPWPMFVIETLLDRALLRVMSEAGTDAPRFAIAPAVQTYAFERLEALGPGAVLAAEKAHGRYFACQGEPGFVRALEAGLGQSLRSVAGRELDNLAVAIERAIARDDGETAAACAHLLCTLAQTGTATFAALKWGPAALAIISPPRLRSWLSLRLAHLGRQSARGEDASAIAERVIGMARELKDPALMARALDVLAASLMDREVPSFEAVREACEEGLVYARQADDQVGEGLLEGRLGLLCLQACAWTEAREHFQKALTLHREVQDRTSEAADLAHLGALNLELGNLPEAARTSKAAVELARAVGAPGIEADALSKLGVVMHSLGRYEEARRLDERSLTLYRSSGDKRHEARVLGQLGDVHLSMMDLAAAREVLEAGIETADSVGDGATMGTLRATLAEVTATEGDVMTARYLLRAAESFLRDSGSLIGLGSMLCRKARIECRVGNLVGAWTTREQARAMALAGAAPPASPLRLDLDRLDVELTRS